MRKCFEGVELQANTTTPLDVTKEPLDAGDVTNDNVVNIDDFTYLTGLYIDSFKIPLSSLLPQHDGAMQADIDKDGFITVVDLALFALSYHSFEVWGEE